jgi:sterol desaturase/sphingolipid hydroxylase (fatty acid hydroxylase superfamily)
MSALAKSFADAVRDAPHAALALLACAAAFAALAFALKGRRMFADAAGLAAETRVNLGFLLLGQFLTGPLVTVLVGGSAAALHARGLGLDSAGLWRRIGDWPTLALCVVIGDFIGYWRHRLQHTKWLWPAHAVHHGDTRLSWLSLERMHPVDQLGSALDTVILAALGFPFWALAGNVFVRHYWGYVIHADAPWTLGKAGLVLNSPALHRWHHARDVEGSGHNFATVFSLWDRAFGTLHQPGPCDAPLGVREDLGAGFLGQCLHPFRVWTAAARGRGAELPVTSETPAA